jgi:branched-chain amino acid transport system ATP-binding protein
MVSTQPILSATGLTMEFRGFLAVKDVTLSVNEGTIHALIGPNGAGKTTVFNLLTKFLTPTRGQITFKGSDITSLRPSGLATQFWRHASALSTLDDRAMELIDAVGLRAYAHLPAVELSYGRKRALEIATTLALDPAMLLLDEPMAGMGHEDIGRISDLIRRIAHNRTVLMVEHNLNVVSDLCDRVTVLARGEILSDGSYDKVSQDPRVREAYMGTEHE